MLKAKKVTKTFAMGHAYYPVKYLKNICDRACKNQPSEHKKLPIFSMFAVS